MNAPRRADKSAEGKMAASRLYDQDFYAWANEQAALLRAGKLGEADIEHIAEEIESLGKTEKRELASRLKVLILHLLKWRHQPFKRTPSWEVSIKIQRHELVEHLVDNPSLKPVIASVLQKVYPDAVLGAVLETGFPESIFPETCPWTFEEMMAEDFWPEG
ncbi:DUF29 domain-containing protein [Methylocystis sp.]|uniref:DUF29 domain-containing protein n=1 Tax=Methylocystis sp. TaxID=1911079 RepID=UPI003DA3F9E8